MIEQKFHESSFLTQRERLDRIADRIEQRYNTQISSEHRDLLENKIDELEGIIWLLGDKVC